MGIDYELLLAQLSLSGHLCKVEEDEVTVHFFGSSKATVLPIKKDDKAGSLIKMLRLIGMFKVARSLSDLRGVIATNLKASAYVHKYMPDVINGENWVVCARCGNLALKSELPEYPYQCMACCDEDLFSIETKKAPKNALVSTLIEQVADMQRNEEE